MNRRGFLGKGALALGAAGLAVTQAQTSEKKQKKVSTSKILNYDERMDYRRLGKTDWMVSAISMGGHWKRLKADGADFDKNRAEIMAKAIDSGINYIDACWSGETVAYAKALKKIGKRDKMYFGFSSGNKEMRFEKWRTRKMLLRGLEEQMLDAKLDHVDLWRVTCHESGRLHTFGEIFEMIDAGERAVKEGKCRAFGLSTHDRRFIEHLLMSFPIISAVCMPYTARSKKKPKGSLFDAFIKQDVGLLGIKPFASNSMFKGDSQPGNPFEEEDNERARLALRYILCNEAVTAPIPGLITTQQVDNCLKAIAERREQDLCAAPEIMRNRRFAHAAGELHDRLTPDYQWLKKWEWV